MSDFSPDTFMLLDISLGDKLTFIDPKTGKVYDATPESTLLLSSRIEDDKVEEKYRDQLLTTAFDPINPRINKECNKCHRQIVSYQRIGDMQKVFYACVCGHIWTNC